MQSNDCIFFVEKSVKFINRQIDCKMIIYLYAKES